MTTSAALAEHPFLVVTKTKIPVLQDFLCLIAARWKISISIVVAFRDLGSLTQYLKQPLYL